jgi:hypothetical protein
MSAAFVAPDFKPPTPPVATEDFVLVPLDVSHNEGDLDAWNSSVNHIHATPGFSNRPWPDEPMTLERNAADLQGHVDDFANRQGFTYSVLEPSSGRVIGCVYIYPSTDDTIDADIRSWVRVTHAPLDAPLYRSVTHWLQDQWPFRTLAYAERV